MNKRILAAAALLGLAGLACGFGGTAPTATPIIVVVTSTPVPTVEQPAPTAVQPTLSQGQPTQSTGSSSSGLPFSDDFTDPSSGWASGSYNGGNMGYGNGYYFIKVTTGGDLLYNTAPMNGVSDAVVSVDTVQYDAPSDNNTAVGIVCRLQNDSSGDGYDFRLSGSGMFSVVMYNNGGYTSLMPGNQAWQPAPSANQGNVSNHIVVSCSGNHLTFKVNGKTLFDATDNTFSSGGFGLLGAVYDNNSTAEFHFTDFQAKAP